MHLLTKTGPFLMSFIYDIFYKNMDIYNIVVNKSGKEYKDGFQKEGGENDCYLDNN